MSQDQLAALIKRELITYELNGGTILDAIAVYHHDDTVKEALEIVGDWSARLAFAIVKGGEMRDV